MHFGCNSVVLVAIDLILCVWETFALILGMTKAENEDENTFICESMAALGPEVKTVIHIQTFS